jgi:hypothetical protein
VVTSIPPENFVGKPYEIQNQNFDFGTPQTPSQYKSCPLSRPFSPAQLGKMPIRIATLAFILCGYRGAVEEKVWCIYPQT